MNSTILEYKKSLKAILGAAVFIASLPTNTYAQQYEIRAMHSDKCMDVARSCNSDGATVIQYRCGNTTNQRWILTEGPSGYFEIRARHSDKCLDVPRSSTDNATEVIQYRCGNTTNQRWRLTEGPTGYFEIRAMHSDKCLDVPRSSRDDGVHLIQYTCGSTTNQRWRLTQRGAVGEHTNLPVIAMSLHGSSSSSSNMHDIADSCSGQAGIDLDLGSNWLRDSGDGVAGDGDAEDLRDRINGLVASNGGDKSRLALLLMGKSAGGVLAWNTLKRHYGNFRDFGRVALVLIDPHGSVRNDGRTGPYKDSQSLWWPEVWSGNAQTFRVYNVFQHRKGLTGASFPDCRVYRNDQIRGGNISHSNILEHATTCSAIRSAARFAREGR